MFMAVVSMFFPAKRVYDDSEDSMSSLFFRFRPFSIFGFDAGPKPLAIDKNG